MIKFTMGSSGNQKTHRRKPKRSTKSYVGYQNTAGGGGLCMPAVGLKSSVLPSSSLSATSTVVSSSCNTSVDNSNLKLTFSPVNTTYLQSLPRDRCLICHAPRSDDRSQRNGIPDATDDTVCSGVGVGFMPSQLQLWMCSECRQTVEEENEKRSSRSLLDQDLMVGPPTSPANLSSASDTETSAAAADAAQTCCCDSCNESRQMELQQEQQAAELSELWKELRQKLLSTFCSPVTQPTVICSASDSVDTTSMHHTTDDSIHDLIARFCTCDPHGLYKRIECLAREHMVKRKSCLTPLYTSPPSDDVGDVGDGNVSQMLTSVDKIVSALFHEYDGLMHISETISAALTPLEEQHLKRFHLTVELQLRQLFRSIIFVDLQKHVPDIEQKLRNLIAANESKGISDNDELTRLLLRYLRFDDEMLQVAIQWRDCFQLIEQYNDEQTELSIRQKVLREDWEFFRSQRRLLEQQLCEQKTSNHGLEDDATTEAAVWQLLHANKADSASRCRNYAQQSPELTDQLSHDVTSVTSTPSYCFADMLPQMLTAGAGSQLPMMFGAITESDDQTNGVEALKETSITCSIFSQQSGTQDVIDDEYEDEDEIETDDEIEADDDDDDDDDCAADVNASLYVDHHSTGLQSPNCKTDVPSSATQQHCQCHYCYQQSSSHSPIDSTMRPFFLQPPLQPSSVHSYSQHLAANCGLAQPSSLAPPPHLYHLHCDTAAVSQSPQRVPGDGSAILTAPLSSIYHDAPQTDVMLCNIWQDAFVPLAKCPPSFPAVSGLAFATAAGSMPTVGSHTDTSHGTLVSASLANSGASSPWKMSSPAVFSASLIPTQPPSTGIQHVPRFFQPHFFPDVAQAPVKFTNGLPPDCGGLAMTAGNMANQDGIGDEPVGKRFVPCWHSVAASTTYTSTISTSPQTGIASRCLSAAAVVSTSAAAANVFSPVKSDKPLVTHTSPAAANAVANCRQNICDSDIDDDDEEDDDDESVSDESSSTSNQKDGGKYCECWRCEFFGHADPPTLPTSKNYPEMRERLRLRLKKKNEEQNTGTEPTVSHDVTTTADILHEMDVDDLLKYINGDDDKSQAKMMTRKAAKRARQKQRKAAEKLQENVTSDVTHQSTGVSSCASSLKNTATVTTVSASTVAASAEPLHSTQNKKMLAKTACPLGGSDSTAAKSKAVCTTVATTAVSHTQCLSQSACAKPLPKQSSECHKHGSDKTKTAQPSTSSSSVTTDTCPQFSTKLVRGRRGQKIGQPQDVVNSSQQAAVGQKNKQPVAKSFSPSSSPMKDAAVKTGCSRPVDSRTSNAKSETTSRAEKSSQVITQLPNGLVAHAGKMCGKANHVSQTNSATLRGYSPLPNGLQAHADKRFAKTNHLTCNTSNEQRGLEPGTDTTSEPLSGSVGKTWKKTDNVAGTCLEQNGQVNISESSKVCGQSASLMDVIGDGGQVVTTHSDQNGATMTGKGKKARRKGRGKALTSVDDIFLPKEVECTRMDDFEREIEEFKRFCFNSSLADRREKVQVNMNIKDIFAKKKSANVV